MLIHRLMNKIVQEDNSQKTFVSMKDSIIEMRFCDIFFHCHTEALRKKFREVHQVK